jgi:hypothetical protein
MPRKLKVYDDLNVKFQKTKKVKYAPYYKIGTILVKRDNTWHTFYKVIGYLKTRRQIPIVVKMNRKIDIIYHDENGYKYKATPRDYEIHQDGTPLVWYPNFNEYRLTRWSYPGASGLTLYNKDQVYYNELVFNK